MEWMDGCAAGKGDGALGGFLWLSRHAYAVWLGV